MTDAEFEIMAERAYRGELTEAELEAAEAHYNRVTDAAIANGERLLADPAAMAEATRDCIVPAPRPKRRRRAK